MHEEICKIANVMKSQGVKKGDVVTVYMPMIPQLPMVMLACARIGAIHSVVFAGFSSEALKGRIRDCKSKWLFVSDEGKRGGKAIHLKSIADEALAKGDCEDMKNVFVFKRTGTTEVEMTPKRDIWMNEVLPTASKHCPVEEMNSEDPLFIIYTSGSTGKPKGVVHATAGYLLYTSMAAKTVFDIREKDVFCCVADCGWITGHSYVVYGPLVNGVTACMFESIPTYPDPYRYWDLIQKYRPTQFYTAPTAIRALMRFTADPIKKYDLSSVRLLGTAGEPINPEAWEWYWENVGHKGRTVLDTYWQTETGGPIVTNLPGACVMKPGACMQPFYGIELVVLDSQTGKEIVGNNIEGVLAIKQAWPGLARTVFGDHERFLHTYMKPYAGYYFTGDACRRDADGSYWITGRVDDVINPSGHRIGTAEIEGILDEAEEVTESAVVGFPHPVKGEGIGCFVVLKDGAEPSEKLIKFVLLAVFFSFLTVV
jgi:acetyl-CoA synthetase